MTSTRTLRWLVGVGLLAAAAFVIGAGGAYPRYNRIAYGAVPLAVTLVCLGGAAWLRRGRVRAVLGLCCWLAAFAAMGVWFRPSLAGAVTPEPRWERAHVLLTLERDRIRSALFAELQPVEIPNCRLERFGEPHDGGYLMCGNLLGSIRAGYSYGISGYDQWGCDIARRFSVPVHQYDCFDPTRPQCPGGLTVFHDECLGPSRRTDDRGRIFDTLQRQLAGNGDGAARMAVKIDVEGAEWDTLLQAPAAVLERIDQLVVEFHGVAFEHQLATVRRLGELFHVAHVHFNNNACATRIDPFPAWVYEVSFVNKRITAGGAPRALEAHPLDASNSAALPDCQAPTSRWSLPALGSWPFSRR